MVAVQTLHRYDIARARSIANNLFAELARAATSEDVVELCDEWPEVPGGAVGPLTERAAFAANLPPRIRVAKDLVETMQRVISMERLTFGLGADTADGLPVVIIHDFTGRRNEAWLASTTLTARRQLSWPAH